MAKYTSPQYARALYELCAESSQEALRSVLDNFVNVLLVHNDLSKGGEIIREFEKLFYRERGIAHMEVSMAGALMGESLRRRFAGDTLFKKDPGLIGGAKIKIEDMMVNNTLQGRLARLKESLIRHG